MIEITNCQICKSNDLSQLLQTKDYFFTEENFTLTVCNNCNFVFTNPIPDIDSIGKYYATEKYLSHDTNNNGILSNIYKTVRYFNLQGKYSLINKYKNSGQILDIGSGTGEFLNFMKQKNWNTFGIEPEKKAREFAINNYQLNIFPESKLKELENNKFDLITMWHVLEHVYDLNERLNVIYNLLEKDGIFINALPMIDSPDAKKFGKYWAGLDVPRHLHHFTSESFTRLANNNGFKVIDSFPMKFDAYYVSYLSHQAKKSLMAFLRGLIDGFISNLKADKNRNYSSMIFVLGKS